ncbi:MAG: hypothetical protein [Microviridae sp.]|nr:MAG: hypothetical protein [Microviridae sp.]
MKIVTIFDYVPTEGEVNTMPSKTVPDQTMSIKEIMQRYGSGQALSQKVPVYDGDEDYFPDLRTMDLAEIEQMKLKLADDIDHLKNRLERNEKSLKQLELTLPPEPIQTPPVPLPSTDGGMNNMK